MYLTSEHMLLFNKTDVQTMPWGKPGINLFSSHIFKDLVHINEISNCCALI